MLTARFPSRSSHPRNVDQMLESVLSDWPVFGVPARPLPALNAWEDAQNVFVEAELPGLRIEDLHITMTGNELTIAGSRPAADPDHATFFRRERHTGSFTRTIRFGVDLDSTRVQASLVNGVLTVTLPKAESARPRKIDVKVNG